VFIHEVAEYNTVVVMKQKCVHKPGVLLYSVALRTLSQSPLKQFLRHDYHECTRTIFQNETPHKTNNKEELV